MNDSQYLDIKHSQNMATDGESASRNYRRIEHAIAFIRKHHRSQPSLAEIAETVHLSEIHFQKMFTAWAGISPKRFIKYLTLTNAKTHLQQGMSVVDAAFGSGLSGPGRLHDLFITMEAVTPGEYKALGHGLTIDYTLHETPFGQVFIAVTDKGICQLNFLSGAGFKADWDSNDREKDTADNLDHSLQQLTSNWPGADVRMNEQAGVEEVRQIFRTPHDTELKAGLTTADDHRTIKLLAKGTNFQVQVWQALLQLPYGEITSYQRIANALEKPKAVRAVASAIGANPLAYIIPCHRVLRGNAEFGGYRWGLDKKAALLAYEQCQAQT